MQIKQLLKYLSSGDRNMSEPPLHLRIGETAICSVYASDIMNKDTPYLACILDKAGGEQRQALYLVQKPDGKNAWVNAEFFWTKEQVVRFFVAGPKGKKGSRKYRRIMGKMRRINFS